MFIIVARIALVKPEKARGVEDVILRAAQMGQIIEKVTFVFASSCLLMRIGIEVRFLMKLCIVCRGVGYDHQVYRISMH